VWQDRLPSRYSDAGPRFVAEPNPAGGAPFEVWHYEGGRYPELGLNVAGRPPEDFRLEPVRYADMIPGCYDPKARRNDMDLDGVHVALCFPTFPHCAGLAFVDGEDKELATLCVRAYNDFVIEEWCATAPERFIPLVILPIWDTAECLREIHRTAAMGARGISRLASTVVVRLPSFHTDHWDRVFAVVEETGLPLCLHFGSSGYNPITAMDAPFAVTISLFGCNSM
jgi:predicted TIM-barrel fold metal-dependent hydrolase